MKQSAFNELLAKEMTRKEFILHIGLLFLVITGISGLLKTISNPDLLHTHSAIGFGSGSYGGTKKV